MNKVLKHIQCESGDLIIFTKSQSSFYDAETDIICVFNPSDKFIILNIEVTPHQKHPDNSPVVLNRMKNVVTFVSVSLTNKQLEYTLNREMMIIITKDGEIVK